MLDLFFSDNATWYSVPALVGSGIFLVRLALMFMGHAGGMDVDHDVSIDAHADVPDAHHDGDSNAAFKILSLQTIAAFAMGFGWGGLGVVRGTHWDPLWAVPVGIAMGAAMVWVLGLLLKAAYDLQSSGNIRLADAVGVDGTVYVTVPAEGSGKGQVQLVLSNRQRIYNAVTDGPAITTRSRVRVVGVNDDNTVTVQAV
jgi:hypothetical protein